MSTTVTYEGSTIATVNNNTKTLQTAGKYLTDDITLVDVSQSGSAAISITDELDSHGGTIRHINGVDISDSTIDTDKVLSGYVGYKADGTRIVGTASAGITPTGTVSITENGTHDVTNYAGAEVNVRQTYTATAVISNTIITTYDIQIGSGPRTTITDGGVYSYKAEDTIVVRIVDGGIIYYNGVEVARNPSDTFRYTFSAPSVGLHIECATDNVTSVMYITELNGSAWLIEKNVTSNGTYNAEDDNADGYSSVTVNVPTGTARTSANLTASGATVTVPAGLYSEQATKSVASGTEGTPVATKGTVSNHAVSVTPSVTNTEGYISGGARAGTAVSVSASELVSGTLTVDSSGTKDVTNYASASVPSGTAGTPSATKGTVSNHSVSVTPSVTNITGWIVGSTKTGTAVTVSASELVSGTLNVSKSGTQDVTNYENISVPAGSEGTPSATKGTVNNHSISVTPSVTNSGGYIAGGTKTGTAVNVSASELVSGSETKTANGTYDVTNLANLVVAVPIVTYYTGSSAPSSSLGSNGDIYLQTN